MGEYSPSQTNTLRIVIFICNASSIFSASFIILSEFFCRSLRCNFACKLIFYVAISNLIASIGNIIRYHNSGLFHLYPDTEELCTAQGIVREFGNISYVLWIVIISYTMNYLTVRKSYPSSVELHTIFPIMHIIIWPISILFTLLPLITNSYQIIKHGWCSMNDFWQYISFFVPLWCSIIYIIYIYYKTWKQLKKVDNMLHVPLSSSTFNEVNSEINSIKLPIFNENNSFNSFIREEKMYRFNTLQKLKYFPLILIIFYFVFPTVVLIIDKIYNPTPFIIILLMYTFMSLPAVFNCILFILLIITNRPTTTHPKNINKNALLCNQIIILYNSISGAKKALSLLPEFDKYTNIYYDMIKINSNNDLLNELGTNLKTFENNIIVGIVGGDGSNEWGCSIIDRALKTQTNNIKYPIIVPFPVGTGNDLSRALGWNNIGIEPNKVFKHISDILYCYNISKRFDLLDRWNIKFRFEHIENKLEYKPEFEEEKHDIHNNNIDIRTDKYLRETYDFIPSNFFCYLSFGYCASISYEWEMERKKSPHKFVNQKYGIFVYQKLGFKKIIKQIKPINDSIKCFIDGKECQLPNKCRSLKVINCNSMHDGVYFWGTRNSKKNELNDDKWKKPQLNDGLVEIVATTGPLNGLESRLHLSHARRLGQSANIEFHVLKVPIFIQMDGEGYKIDKKCVVRITLNNQLKTLIGYKKPRGVDYKYEALTDVNNYTQKQIENDRNEFMKNIQKNQLMSINNET